MGTARRLSRRRPPTVLTMLRRGLGVSLPRASPKENRPAPKRGAGRSGVCAQAYGSQETSLVAYPAARFCNAARCAAAKVGPATILTLLTQVA